MSELAPSAAAAPDGRDRGLLTHRRMLGDRLYVQTGVRVLAALALVVLARTTAADMLDPRAPGVLLVLAIAIAGYDLGAWALLRHYRSPQQSQEANRLLQNVMYGLVVLDYLALTVLVWVTGGSSSPLLPFYLVHAVVSHLLLSKARAISCVLLAIALITSLVFGELSQLLPEYRVVANPELPHLRTAAAACTLVAAYALLLGLTSYSLVDLTGRLRERESQLHQAIAESTRLSELRKDFLRIATHNLKSPVGAVTMQLENLRSGLLGPVGEAQVHAVARCLERMQGLSKFMYDLQTLSQLDDKAIGAQHVEFEVAPMLTTLVEEYREVAQGQGIELTADLPCVLPRIRGVERLVREAVVNFVTNAIKFTPRGGHVHVRAEQHGDLVRIAVQDDGCGIAPEQQARLFQEFVRLGKQDPNTGSGLGLSIARRVAEAHGGRTRVWSEPGVGSVFTIELPLPRGAAPAA
jgi:signal transduction histidine kinase